MVSFNTLRASAVCPTCLRLGDVTVRFMFGECWRHQYKIGDELLWGRKNNVGKPDLDRVVVDGDVDGPCLHCGSMDPWKVYIFIDSNGIMRADTADGRFDFIGAKNNYIELAARSSKF
jgi:hypothetical protein